jgi:putative IMPACT (imprinted ancient) family translation regulator
MQCLTAPCAFRFREKASVFLTELHPAAGADERAAILARLRKRDFDASHHCSAWREAPSAFGADDDGEPSGTAGAPMLRVLEGEDLVQVLAVCIRWFGGTKLGTGGLVRAYTEGVQGAVAEARAQGLLSVVRVWRQGSLDVPAELAHLPFAVLGAFPEAEILGQDFGSSGASLRFRLPPDDAAALEAAWRDRSRGGRVRWDLKGSG